MRKGPLIAAATLGAIGIIMTIIGAIFYSLAEPTYWANWVMWFGIIVFDIGLIVLVVAFIKKPGEAGAKKESD